MLLKTNHWRLSAYLPTQARATGRMTLNRTQGESKALLRKAVGLSGLALAATSVVFWGDWILTKGARTPMYFPDFQRRSFFSSPLWRWERAQNLIADRRHWSSRRDDKWTHLAMAYLRAAQRCAPRRAVGWLAREFPDVHAAHQLHDQGGRRRLEIEARLLAGQPFDDVAERSAVPTAIVQTYEALFFQVLDRLGARDWILLHAIGQGRADEMNASLLRKFAYFGGPLLLGAVLPYLVGDRDPMAGTLDLMTFEGRMVQSLRLVLLVESLPRGTSSWASLAKIHLQLLNRRANSPPGAPIGSILQRNAAAALSISSTKTQDEMPNTRQEQPQEPPGRQIA